MIRRVLAALIIGCVPLAAFAQDKYPARAITIIVPSAPGVIPDPVARPIAAGLEHVLSQPVAISNKPAAAGTLGAAAVVKAQPDGYTLLLASSHLSIAPEIDRLFARSGSYRMDQLQPVARITADALVLVVPAASPVHSLAEFIEDARKRPNRVSYGSSRAYSMSHIAMAMFVSAADLQLRHSPFNSSAAALTAVLGNNVDALAGDPAALLPHIRAGRLRALASWGVAPPAVLPDLPTFQDLGYRDVVLYVWTGLFVAAGTPAPILATLRGAVGRVVGEPGFGTAMDRLGLPIAYLDAPGFDDFWKNDAAQLIAVVRGIGRVE